MGKPVVHFEIGCRDKERNAHFYSTLFDWQTTPAGPATLIDTGNAHGINGHFVALGHEPHHYVLVYIEVDDLAPYLEQIKTLGGSVVVPAVPLPDGRHFAWLADPEGNTIGIITPNK